MQNPKFGPRGAFGQNRTTQRVQVSPFDITGQANVLINAYLTYFGKLIEAYGTHIIIGLILIVVMILSAYMFLKD